MSIGKGILVVLFIVLASGAMAQIDPDPDGIGIYFDQGATINSAVVAEGTVYVTAYLILTNPSADGNLIHWAARVSCNPHLPYQASLSGSVINGTNLIIENMPGSSHWSFEASIYDDPAYPVSATTILAEILVYPATYVEPIYLYVTEGPEYPAYGTDVGWAYYTPSSGSWDLPVAVINGAAPVAAESKSWGGVKSLYR